MTGTLGSVLLEAFGTSTALCCWMGSCWALGSPIVSWHVKYCVKTGLLLGTAQPSCYLVCSGLCMGSGPIELRAYLFSPAATEPGHPEVLLSKLHLSSCLHRFCFYSSVHCLGHAPLVLHELHSALEAWYAFCGQRATPPGLPRLLGVIGFGKPRGRWLVLSSSSSS